jgi:hypothetical protein
MHEMYNIKVKLEYVCTLKNSRFTESCYLALGYHCEMTDMEILGIYVAMT